ncbi:hypothetical protein [Alkaliphilus transvaalensis]|uniref:hypothetical protein n=1 Tax=Alkaliphilus transvaalensis TaxID=114628 RepID=UPI00047CE4E3|nr:hypothetical protein [Alkaliphilus transvaalensis]
MKKTISKILATLLVCTFALSSASAFTPPGLSKKGGLPPGIQKRFIQAIEKDYAYESTIKAIDFSKRRIVIQEGTAEIHLLVANDAKIELNGKSGKLSDLQVGDQVQIKTNSSNTVVEIKATGGARITPPKQTQIKGVIKNIDLSNKEIVIEDNNNTNLYHVSNTVIYIDNNQKALKDLKVGMEITAQVEGIKIITLYAKSVTVKELQATVKRVDVSRREILLQYDNKEELYKVKSDAVIKINGATQNLSSVVAGTIVTVKIQQGEIIEITGNNSITKLEGRLMSKNLGDTPAITLEMNKEIKNYYVDKELKAVLTHINVGNQVTIYIKDNLVVAIQEKN